MLKRSVNSIATTWLAGLLALLPLALSLALLGWVVSLLNGLIGPSSTVGKLFTGSASPSSAVRNWPGYLAPSHW